ncbi:hypothetical protein [Gemmobacter sp.]|uniref:hypothetical protein n=1 Tax=Gemmobacter sp. TaxID=1898957 RepID=UPI002AFF3475|nr:hypothetical protein [Gemmobacter sp.]
MTLKPGSRWKSTTCTAEAVVVRPAQTAGLPQCGGHDMVPLGEVAQDQPARDGFANGCAVGKRYRDAASGLELLCTRAGQGTLSFGGAVLAMVETKQLPSSD